MLPRAEFAQFGSAFGIIGSICWIILAPLCGFSLDHLHHHYRYTFLMSFGLSLAGIFLLLILHRKFTALGGPKNYVPPE
jgi:MFS family permease